jgi:TonB family protein
VSFVSFVLDSTLKVSLVVCAGLALAGLLRRRSAAARHWVLAATVVCAAALPLLEQLVPAWGVTSASFGIAARAGQTPQVSVDVAADTAGASSGAVETARAGSPAPSRWSPWRLLERTWMLGAAASTLILLIGLVRLAWLASRATEIAEGPWASIAADVAREYGVWRRVELLQSDHPSLLVTWGLFKPRVIIPKAALGWSEDRIRVVLRHELAHISRGDWIVQLAGEAIRAVYWFNPLVWLACTRLRDESEHACDDEVLKRIEGPEYAAHLLELARALKAESAPRVPAPAVARSSSLERRVRAMLDASLVRTPTSRVVRFVTGAALLVLTIGIAAAQTGPSVLSGTVYDSTGAPVPGAHVALVNTRTQAKYEVKADDAGRYEFVPLPADSYQLETEVPAFKRAGEPISLSGKTVRRDVTLSLGELKETVTVSGSPATGAGADTPAANASQELPPSARAGFQRALSECQPSATGGRVRPPRKIKDVRPVYPKHLIDAGIEGSVVLKATVGTDGLVRELSVVKGVMADLDNAAIEAVRLWQFDGTLLNCSPVEVTFNTTVNFKLK